MVAWLTVDKNGEEWIFQNEPILQNGVWYERYVMLPPLECVQVPEGTIEKILGYKLTLETSPVEI